MVTGREKLNELRRDYGAAWILTELKIRWEKYNQGDTANQTVSKLLADAREHFEASGF